jgi:hypothetical protein
MIKKSLQGLYEEVNRQIEEIKQNSLQGNGAIADEITEEEKVSLARRESIAFRRSVREKLVRYDKE